jgi:hypothetical protein
VKTTKVPTAEVTPVEAEEEVTLAHHHGVQIPEVETTKETENPTATTGEE